MNKKQSIILQTWFIKRENDFLKILFKFMFITQTVF